MRRHTFAKISAVWVIALILSPFTAPFATYDLSYGHHEQLFKGKSETEAVILPAPSASAWVFGAPRPLAAPLRSVVRGPLMPDDLVLRL